MRAPANIVTKSQYTIGKEFIYADTYENYQGYYYEMNSKFFVGKKFDPVARELLKVSSESVDKVKLNSKTSTFGKLTNVALAAVKVVPLLYKGESSTRYFVKQINVKPILIKEVDKKTFNSVKNDPLYQRIAINLSSSDNYDSSTLDKADQQMPGLKAFLMG